jgi:hypothetical protein
MPSPAAGLRQIDTPEKQHEFFVAEGDFVSFFARFGPPETSLLQALSAYPEPAAIIRCGAPHLMIHVKRRVMWS